MGSGVSGVKPKAGKHAEGTEVQGMDAMEDSRSMPESRGS